MRIRRLCSLIVLLWLLGYSAWPPDAFAAINADGVGLFPVVVIVSNERGIPLRGIPVRLLDSGKVDSKSRLDPDPEFQRRMESLEGPVETDANGAAVVFYYARWASSAAGNVRMFYHKPRGKIVVELEGYERIEINVPKFTGAQKAEEHSAPIVSLTLKRLPK